MPLNPKPFKVYGLTGGIASGKSEVSRLFANFGVQTLDADAVARKLRQPGGAAYDKIKQLFGTDDPRAIRDKIFADPKLKAALEAILHPLIKDESESRIRDFADAASLKLNSPQWMIYEASLLVETGRYKDLDGLIGVGAPKDLRIARLMDRDKISHEQADKILLNQSTDEIKKNLCDYWIENEGSLLDLHEKVKKVFEAINQ